ncbi:MAG: hypothetical protein IKE93_06795 [Erysipelotrichaceae bacterium]|nr:hypothetical protein [Erysipelotrichaceae bacterium]
MTLLDELKRKEVWNDFLSYKTEKNQLQKREIKQLQSFIDGEKYLDITSFGYPVKKLISKIDSNKKRTVYTYSTEETWILKLLVWLLYRYDDRISDNCYSFRRYSTTKTAFDRIQLINCLDEKHVLKIDIHDYFNSIDVPILLEVLHEIINDDEPLYEFMKTLLTQDRCYYNGELIEEKRGAMAGVPLASFFANIYLLSLDEMFTESYFRYSDDIIIFCDSRQQAEETFRMLKSHIEEKKLTLNMNKYAVSKPHEKWEFLGFSYHDHNIDLSDTAIRKMQGKIRRKARGLYRWRQKNGYSFEKTAVAMIRSFDNRFYDLTGNNEFTWTRFYFPVLTVSDGLHKIDEYMQMYLRYLYSGRHYKGNYDITYQQLKKLGYTPLVSEYYNWKRENNELNRKNHG